MTAAVCGIMFFPEDAAREEQADGQTAAPPLRLPALVRPFPRPRAVRDSFLHTAVPLCRLLTPHPSLFTSMVIIDDDHDLMTTSVVAANILVCPGDREMSHIASKDISQHREKKTSTARFFVTISRRRRQPAASSFSGTARGPGNHCNLNLVR